MTVEQRQDMFIDAFAEGATYAVMIPGRGFGAGKAGLTGTKEAAKGFIKRAFDFFRRPFAKSPGQIGRAGESAVTGAYSIGIKQKILINGRTRIPDGITGSVISEVKNVQSLSYTRQLRDFADIAKQRGLRYDLYVRPSTKLSDPLMQAVKNGSINLRFIPGAK